MRAVKLVDADPFVLAALNYPVVDLKVFSKEQQNCKLCDLLFTQNTGHFALLNEWQLVNSQIKCTGAPGHKFHAKSPKYVSRNSRLFSKYVIFFYMNKS